jgi:hypothetical protein
MSFTVVTSPSSSAFCRTCRYNIVVGDPRFKFGPKFVHIDCFRVRSEVIVTVKLLSLVVSYCRKIKLYVAIAQYEDVRLQHSLS